VGIQGIPFVLVFTKGDKVGKTEQQSSIARFKRAMLKTWDELPPVFATSSETKEGRSDLLKFMLES
jgi:GTP-binding protein